MPEVMTASAESLTTPTWIPPGESSSVAGVEVSGGAYYQSAAVSAAYAQWLAGGRQDRGASPGHTEHFLLDVETRMFELLLGMTAQGAGATRAMAAADVTALRNELSLLGDALAVIARTYAHHQSCTVRANRLLNLIRLGLLGERIHELPAGLAEGRPNLLAARFGLGTRVAYGEKIDAEWALCWLSLEAHRRREDKSLGELVRFGWSFLAQGVRERFGAKHPDGLLISRPQRCLAATYQPITRGRAPIILRFSDMPGLAGHRDLRRSLEPIVDSLQTELGPLVPKLKRAKTSKARLRALASLPNPPFGAEGVAEAEEFKAHVLRLLKGADAGLVELDQLLEGWDDEPSAQLERAELRLLASCLDWIGLSMEPDPRLLGPSFKGDTVVSVAVTEGAFRPTPSYRAARTHLFAWSAVAWADGAIHPAELSVLDEHLDLVFPDLEPEARRRLSLLKTHLSQVETSIPNWPRIIEPLEPAQKRTLGEFLVRVVLADGHAHEDELRETEALFERLGLDSGEVYVHLNRVKTGRDGQGRSAAEAAREAKAAAELTEHVLGSDDVQESPATDPVVVHANTTDGSETPLDPEPAPEPVVEAVESPAIVTEVPELNAMNQALVAAFVGRAHIGDAEFSALVQSQGGLPNQAAAELNRHGALVAEATWEERVMLLSPAASGDGWDIETDLLELLSP